MSTNPNFPAPDSNRQPDLEEFDTKARESAPDDETTPQTDTFNPDRFERVEVTAGFRKYISTAKLPETPEEYLTKDTLPPGDERAPVDEREPSERTRIPEGRVEGDDEEFDGGSREPTEGSREVLLGEWADEEPIAPIVPPPSRARAITVGLLALLFAGGMVWMLSPSASDNERGEAAGESVVGERSDALEGDDALAVERDLQGPEEKEIVGQDADRAAEDQPLAPAAGARAPRPDASTSVRSPSTKAEEVSGAAKASSGSSAERRPTSSPESSPKSSTSHQASPPDKTAAPDEPAKLIIVKPK